MSQVESLHPNVSLGPVTFAVKDKALAWRNDSRVYRWCRQYEPITQEHHEAYWRKVESDPSTKMFGIFCDKESVGVCGLTSIDWVNRRAEFSLYIDPKRQGQGLGEEALRLLCSHGFYTLNLNMIWGEAFENNPAIHIFKKIGFKEEGRRREFYFRDGEYIDAILFSLLRGEYV